MASPASASRASWRAALWLWLGVWIGAMALFGIVARAAFQVVPNPDVAGQMVGAVLGPLLGGGAVSGIALSWLAARLRRDRITILLPLVLSAACLINQFGVSPAVAEIRLGDPGLPPELAARFAALHDLSVGLFVAVAAGAVVLAALHALAEAREARGSALTPGRDG